MERNKVYLGDCIELLKQLDDESVDLIIADPPYNLGKDFGPKSKVWINGTTGAASGWIYVFRNSNQPAPSSYMESTTTSASFRFT